MPETQVLPPYADPDAKAVILSAQPGPVSDPNRTEIIPIEGGFLVLAVHDPGVTDPAMPATFMLDQAGADQLREILDRYFPRYDVD
jgi:hypothetical protein